MGFEIKIPSDISMPGINGRFYEGPLDKITKRI